MSKNIPKGISPAHILEAIQDLDRGVSHAFGDSTGYDLLFNGRRYPPKAVVGLAAGKLTGQVLGPYDFKGGLETECFRILEANGFTIIPKGEPPPTPEGTIDAVQQNWTQEELRASVEAYLDMQRKHRSGQMPVKKTYYEELARKFGRTPKAFEYRMQNISYVLSLQGRDWLPGLRPARNVGTNVAAEIEGILASVEGREYSHQVAFESRVQAEVAKKNLPKPTGNKAPKVTVAQATQYERDPRVKAWVLRNAKGRCECCESNAPFTAIDGSPFLEVHHVRCLADGGSDTVENTVALCPNCHRELHHGQSGKDRVKTLYVKISRLARE